MKADSVGAASCRRPVLRDVIEEHLEEFAYLSIQRRKMLFSPDVGMRGVVGIDARLEAHHDALRVAGPEGVEIAASRLDEPDVWHCYSAARVWIESDAVDPDRIVERLSAADEETQAAWREALRRSPADVSSGLAWAGAGSRSDRALAILTDACGWHGAPLPLPAAVLAESDAPSVRAAAARSVGTSGLPGSSLGSDQVLVDALSRDPDPRVARAALWSLALRAPADALQRCRRHLDSGIGDPFEVQTLGLLGDADDVDRVMPWIAETRSRCSAIRALGHLGSVVAIEKLLALIASTDRLAAAAASDAFETIVGVLPPPPRRRAERAFETAPNPISAHWAEAQWTRLAPSFDGARVWQRGLPFPHARVPDPPMDWIWRRGLVEPTAVPSWMRREVPDGFFDALPGYDARPGE